MDIITIIVEAIISILALIVGRYVIPFIKLKIGEKQAEILVKAAQQMFTEYTGSQKFETVKTNLTKYLNSKNIKFDESEIRYLIESAVKQMKIEMGESVENK